MRGLGVYVCVGVEGDAFVTGSRSFIDVPYMMCLANLHSLYVCHLTAGASSFWIVLPAYTLSVRRFGDPHLPTRSPYCSSLDFVSRCLKPRRCKIASAAYIYRNA